MITDFDNIQIRAKKELKSYFDNIYLNSGARTKAKFLEMLLSAYNNFNVLAYNELVYECCKLRAENQNMQALKQENTELEQEIADLNKDLCSYVAMYNRLKYGAEDISKK